MAEYRRLNYDTLNFSEDIISYEEAVKNTSPLFLMKPRNDTKVKKVFKMMKIKFIYELQGDKR